MRESESHRERNRGRESEGRSERASHTERGREREREKERQNRQTTDQTGIARAQEALRTRHLCCPAVTGNPGTSESSRDCWSSTRLRQRHRGWAGHGRAGSVTGGLGENRAFYPLTASNCGWEMDEYSQRQVTVFSVMLMEMLSQPISMCPSVLHQSHLI